MSNAGVLSTLNGNKSLTAQDLLARMIGTGRGVVTASLKARSVVLLKMVADINPDTPVVFCHASDLFDESRDYRDRIVAQLGLTNVRTLSGESASTSVWNHCEHLWATDPVGGGRVHEIVYLNDLLSNYEAWISAVYHMPSQNQNRVDANGHLLKADPLLDWTDAQVRDFMRANDLPFHPLAAAPERAASKPVADEPLLSHCY